MEDKGSQFTAQDVFESLSTKEQERINSAVCANASTREHDGYSRLGQAEYTKEDIVQTLMMIECEIAENDQWFKESQNNPVNLAREALNLHRHKAEELYSKKRDIVDRLLPESESYIRSVIERIEARERNERHLQQQDFERLVAEAHKECKRESRRQKLSQIKETATKRQEAEYRQQQEAKALHARLQEEDLNRKRALEAERREKFIAEIQARVSVRKIRFLVHFTPLTNLPSILENGLHSRKRLDGHDFIFTDEYRTDGWLDWISVSISFPNYKMFCAKRNSRKDIEGWAVVLLRPEVLWELDCKFLFTNAASSGIKMFEDKKWSSIEAFEDMFGYHDHRNIIPEWYTTDPQAEVMVFNEIPIRYIEDVAVENACDAASLKRLMNVSVIVRPDLFSWRSDYAHWHKFRLRAFPQYNDLVAPF